MLFYSLFVLKYKTVANSCNDQWRFASLLLIAIKGKRAEATKGELNNFFQN